MAKKSQNGRKIPEIPDAVKNIAIWTLQYGQNLSRLATNQRKWQNDAKKIR